MAPSAGHESRRQSFLHMIEEDDKQLHDLACRARALDVDDLKAVWAASSSNRVENLCWRLWSKRQLRQRERATDICRGEEPEIPTSAAFVFGLIWIGLMASVGHLITSTSLKPTLLLDGTQEM
mmetsp:Transcript_4775/g.13241  ORF Transcript_4775/g.13241 Transcript_4775/m.13241 type:complete len:123 (-) Transcript_4775:559-927(-)